MDDRLQEASSRVENVPTHQALAPARPPSPLPFHGRYLFGSVAFGALSSSGFTVGRGGAGPTCFPMGRLGCLGGLRLVAGRLWFLVEGLDQGCAKARKLFRAPPPARPCAMAEGLPGAGRSRDPRIPPSLFPNEALSFPDLGLWRANGIVACSLRIHSS